jgi:D-aminopeptidase
VGETNDGGLNDIRGRHVKEAHVVEAIKKAQSGPVEEGCVGAGTGTTCYGFKGGIGTASRKLPDSRGGYTVGVLAQTNHGGVLQINGFPVGIRLGNYYMKRDLGDSPEGSCMIASGKAGSSRDSKDRRLLFKRKRRLCHLLLHGRRLESASSLPLAYYENRTLEKQKCIPSFSGGCRSG